jgi:hypothetical protein
MLRIYECGFAAVLVKPVETDRQPKDLIVVPEGVCLQFVFLAVSDIVNNLLERTGRVALTRECPCITTTVDGPWRVNPLQDIAAGSDPLTGELVLKPPVDEEFVTLSGGRLEEQRR